jgi:hypothetical protein
MARPVTKYFIAASALALLLLQAGSLRAQEVHGVRAAGMPSLTPQESEAWRQDLGLSADRQGHATSRGKLGRLVRLFRDGGRSDGERGVPVVPSNSPVDSRTSRAAKQATLGLVELNGDFGERVQAVDSSGRFVTIEGDVHPLPGQSEMFRAGIIAAHWMTKMPDVSGDRGRPKNSAWGNPDRLPSDWKMNKLDADWRGVGDVRGSRGHFVPNSGATFSQRDKLATFQLWRNALYQTEYSNAGAWRDFEKMIQSVAESGDYNVLNVAGPIWEPVTFKKSDGTEAVQSSEMVEFRGKRIPKPAAYARYSIIFPTRDRNGNPMDLADALPYARPVGIIVPNADDPDVYVQDYRPYLATGAEISRAMKVKLLPHLTRGPKAKQIRRALLNHRDTGRGLPLDTSMPGWKLNKMRQLARNLPLARKRIKEHERSRRRTQKKGPRQKNNNKGRKTRRGRGRRGR